MMCVFVRFAGMKRAKRAIHVFGIAAFHFDLYGRVRDVKMMLQFLDHRAQNLLPFPNALLGNDDVTTACDHA